ncbi:hypothetical protein QWJ90_14015 [Microbacterium oryzae]|uniref:hypothetical protein n=1 Tax=Microbacterium oryzae TaxID=743009 RepID=UPI0025B01224|nr:hypothetical protein [Microbacterium oryzae]MDN3312046.1 hypothetical protein [Microbacterium oryzae]
MASNLIDEDPELAHEHALAAVRHAGRIGVARETLAITAYANGDFSLALRELRTQRRITGRNDNVALIVDSERGVGRPEKALEEGRAADRDALDVAARVELAIAMSGARLDLGQTELALHELDIPELDPDRAFEWSPGLFAARANVLEDLGRTEEAASWRRRAEVAERALSEHRGADEDDFMFVDDTDTEELPFDEAEQDAQNESDAEPQPDDEAADADSESRDEAEQDVADIEPESDDDSADHETPDDPAAETPAEPEVQPASEPQRSSKAESAPSDEEMSIEDEVSELLIAAGIDSADEDEDEDDASSEKADGSKREGDRPDGALF